MATIHPIKPYRELAQCAKTIFTGCVDNTLQDGNGLISSSDEDGDMKHWFGSLTEPKTTWTQITPEDKSSKALAIGQGHFVVGKEIFKFGQPMPVCTARATVVSSTQGSQITRMLQTGEVLEIVHESLGMINQHAESRVIMCRMYSVVEGKLEQTSETYTRLVGMNLGMYYLKGYIVMECDFNEYKLIDLMRGQHVDSAFHPGMSQLRFMDSCTKLGVFTHPPPVFDYDNDDYPEVYQTLCGTLDILDGKFAFSECEHTHAALLARVKLAYGIPPATTVMWSDCKYVTDTIMVVNFRLACCVSNPGNNATPAGHPDCVLHSTRYTDTYGLIYTPTNTVIRLRDRPTFGKVLSNTPDVISMHYSHDRRYLAVVVKSKEAIAIPTSNYRVIVIDTVTGKYDTVFSVKTGGEPISDATPCILAVNSTTSPSVVFQVFGFTLNQPIFKARSDAIATKLHEQARGTMPMEIMLKIVDYLC
jgi:hypothetical protein